MVKTYEWLMLAALVYGQMYLYGCTTVFGGPDHLDVGVNLTELTGVAKTEMEACVWQYRLYAFEEKDIMKRCTEAYNGLRNPPKTFVKLVESNFGRHKPPTGFRMRQEIRTLSDEQRAEVFRVIQELYKRGITREFGLVHSHGEMRNHQGAAFLPWHRMFVLHFEEEMRKINPNVVLPYWDYSIDAELEKANDSIVWTDCFFGNIDGFVTTGPFGNNIGRYGDRLARYCGYWGKRFPLISKKNISMVLNGTCHFEEITTGRSAIPHNLEPIHGNVHMWIGGDFEAAPTSAFDLIFYMHHAFIDLIFQKFRDQQMDVTKCGHIDIEKDYRPLDNLSEKHQHHHGPDDPVPGYGHLRNIDLLWRNWTTEFFNYAPQPSCPDNCSGKYLYCDYSDKNYPHGKCMTRTKHDGVPCTPFKGVADLEKEKEKGAGQLQSAVQNALKFIYSDKSN